MEVSPRNVAVTSTNPPTIRVSGVDLKQGEQLVRRLVLHHHLLPVYRSPPLLTDTATSTIAKLLADPSAFTSLLPPSIDPSWRAHEQNSRQAKAKQRDSGDNKKNIQPKSGSGGVPPKRASRKRAQLVALIRILSPLIIAQEENGNLGIVDFCAGCGHVGLLIAALFPQTTVTLVDVKSIALGIAEKRAQAAGLQNVRYVESSVRDIPDDVPCDIAVALHACGDASDDILEVATNRGAAIVIAPCCVGSLAVPISSSHLGKSGRKYQSNNSVDKNDSKVEKDNMADGEVMINLPRANSVGVKPKSKALSNFVNTDEFALLAQAADYSELMTGKDHWRGVAKMVIEKDRLVGLYEKGYSCTMLVKMRPEDCTPKNDVLVAWPRGLSNERESQILNAWTTDQRANGAVDDFLDSSVLKGLGAEEVAAVERMLREEVCHPDSSGIYISPPGGGKRARKVIHAVADGLDLAHESAGKGATRNVIVSRHKYWPIFYDDYIGIGGPHINSMAKKLSTLISKECVERKRFVRGEAHHLTIISPTEMGKLPAEFKDNREESIKYIYQELSDSQFHIIGIGEVTNIVQEDDTGSEQKNDSYFAVINWPEAQNLRRKLGLPRFHFHITLGFTHKDIYHVVKDKSTLIQSFEVSCYPWIV